jgi:hypothetical protein
MSSDYKRTAQYTLNLHTFRFTQLPYYTTILRFSKAMKSAFQILTSCLGFTWVTSYNTIEVIGSKGTTTEAAKAWLDYKRSELNFTAIIVSPSPTFSCSTHRSTGNTPHLRCRHQPLMARRGKDALGRTCVMVQRGHTRYLLSHYGFSSIVSTWFCPCQDPEWE